MRGRRRDYNEPPRVGELWESQKEKERRVRVLQIFRRGGVEYAQLQRIDAGSRISCTSLLLMRNPNYWRRVRG